MAGRPGPGPGPVLLLPPGGSAAAGSPAAPPGPVPRDGLLRRDGRGGWGSAADPRLACVLPSARPVTTRDATVGPGRSRRRGEGGGQRSLSTATAAGRVPRACHKAKVTPVPGKKRTVGSLLSKTCIFTRLAYGSNWLGKSRQLAKLFLKNQFNWNSI